MKKYIFIVVCILFVYTSRAQQMVPGDIPTPNASSLGMYGNIPASYYTGRINITIPIYEMQATGLTLPIYLPYDDTHQDKSFDQGPSNEDLYFMQQYKNMFFFILHANNNIYGVRNINGKLKGWSNEHYLENVSNALAGKISLSYIIKFFSK